MTTIDDNICYMFNQIYLNLMKEVKDKNGEIKHALKESYKVTKVDGGQQLLGHLQSPPRRSTLSNIKINRAPVA